MPSDLEAELPDDADFDDGDGPHLSARKPAPKTSAPEPEEEEDDAGEAARAAEEEAYRSRVVDVARRLGLKKAQIDATPTEQLVKHVQIEAAARRAEGRAGPREEPKKPEPEPEDEEFDHEITVKDVRRKAKLSDYDPAFQKLYKENKSLQKQLEAKAQADADRERRGVFAKLDEAFAALPEKYRKFLGDETMDELVANKDAKKVALRNALASTTELKGHEAQATFNRRVEKAADEMFGDLVKDAPGDEDVAAERNGKPKNGKPSRVEKWERAKTARPSGRRSAAPERSKQAAIAELDQLMIDAGLEPGRPAARGEDDTLGGDDDI